MKAIALAAFPSAEVLFQVKEQLPGRSPRPRRSARAPNASQSAYRPFRSVRYSLFRCIRASALQFRGDIFTVAEHIVEFFRKLFHVKLFCHFCCSIMQGLSILA